MRPPLLWISVAFGAGLWAGLDSFPGSGAWGVVALGLAAALLVARGAPVGAAMGVMGVAGLLWGARSGVQFSLTLVTLKAMPVLIIGGFDSIEGAIVGGLVVGASEKLAEVYVGALVGGGIENWFPYFLAVGLLLARPAGLFGDRTVERV